MPKKSRPKKTSSKKSKSTTKPRSKKPPTLQDLKEDPENPRTIDEGALAGLSTSLEEFGDLSGLTWNSKTGTLVSGHQRLKALREKHGDDLKVKDGSVVTPDGEVFKIRVVDWPAEKHRLANLAANSDKIAGTFTGVAVEQLSQMKIAFPDLSADLRMDDLRIDLEGQFATEVQGGRTDPEDIPDLPKKAITKPGDLWLLGEHLVLCGDASKNYGLVKNPRLLVTSPPYWIGKEYEVEKTEDEIINFIRKHTTSWALICDGDCRIIINTGYRKPPGQHTSMDLLLPHWAIELDKHGWYLRHARIWSKSTGYGQVYSPKSDGAYLGWEFLATFGKRKAKHRGQERIAEPWAQQGIWEIQGDRHGEGSTLSHLATFPSELPSRFIRLYTKRGEIIFDPFLGSGTTLIAAEQLGRRCFGLEIEPRYVDVIVERWQNFTGKKAKRSSR